MLHGAISGSIDFPQPGCSRKFRLGSSHRWQLNSRSGFWFETIDWILYFV